MTRNLISYIFIYVLLIGCESNVLAPSECESDFEMEMGSSDLVIDENGYYHIEWLNNYTQTFATLEVVTNTEGYNPIYWNCDSGIEYGGEFISCVNGVSYTSDGVAKQTMAVWEEMIGDTLTVYSGFEDWCYDTHMDFIKIVVDNEI